MQFSQMIHLNSTNNYAMCGCIATWAVIYQIESRHRMRIELMEPVLEAHDTIRPSGCAKYWTIDPEVRLNATPVNIQLIQKSDSTPHPSIYNWSKFYYEQLKFVICSQIKLKLYPINTCNNTSSNTSHMRLRVLGCTGSTYINREYLLNYVIK